MPAELTAALGRSLRAATAERFGVSATGTREALPSLEPPDAMRWQASLGRRVGLRQQPPTLFLWRAAARGLMVPRADTAKQGFEPAASALADHGWPVTPRACGGKAFPVDDGTLQLALIRPRSDTGAGAVERFYKGLAAMIGEALATFGVAARVGSVPDAFCEGRYDVAIGGRKIAGISQSWKGTPEHGYVLATATLLVAGPTQRLVAPGNRFYDALGEPSPARADALTSLNDALQLTCAERAASGPA